MILKELYEKVCNKLKEAGIGSANLDAGVLIAHVLGQDKTFVLSHPEFELGETQKRKILNLANKRSKSVPIAYLLGHKEFFGYDFLGDKRVLIPRPETEFLVELGIQFVKRRLIDNKKNPLSLIDMGTGSGCIIISLVNQLVSESVSQYFKYYASDISNKALAVAKKNARVHGVQDKINFFHSDLFSNPRLPQKFDLIIANLPYVPKARSKKQELRIMGIADEPQAAIFANDNGASVIKEFLTQSTNRLTPHGAILLELDPRNADEIKKTAKRCFPTANIELQKDLAKRERYLKIRQS